MKAVIFLIGQAGSGKSTIGKELSKKLSIPHISSGDLVRLEINSGSELGLELDKYLKQGIMSPSNLTKKLKLNRFNEPDCDKGFLLDGAPRSLDQLEHNESLLLEANAKIIKVIYLKVDKEICFSRLDNRKRTDDEIEIRENRYQLFLKDTIPLLEYFNQQNLVIEIDASQSPKDIISKLMSLLN